MGAGDVQTGTWPGWVGRLMRIAIPRWMDCQQETIPLCTVQIMQSAG